MIHVTNDIFRFMNANGPIYIYGSGKTGYWTGKYMNMLNMQYSAYIDKIGDSKGECELNSHHIYNINFLEHENESEIRIIVASCYYEEIIVEILFYAEGIEKNILCYVPRYSKAIDKNNIYFNANRMLAFFRKKLLHGLFPTFLSNDCTAGLIYEAFDQNVDTPLINTAINNSDYLKLCRDVRKYMSRDLNNISFSWDSIAGRKMLKASLDDIEIFFGHDDDKDVVKKRWNLLRDRINYNNLVLIMSDRYGLPKTSEIRNFKELPYSTHIMYGRKHGAIIPSNEDVIYFNEQWLFDCTDAIENHFDIIAWVNEIIDKKR